MNLKDGSVDQKGSERAHCRCCHLVVRGCITAGLVHVIQHLVPVGSVPPDQSHVRKRESTGHLPDNGESKSIRNIYFLIKEER